MMKAGSFLVAGILLVFTFSPSPPGFAAGLGSIGLPGPQREGGKPLMYALNHRMSARTFSGQKLSMQTLSDLLWAAFGINRPDGKRTAPSARNRRETDIYVAAPDGVYRYDPEKNALDIISKKDVRAMTGVQEYVRNAAVNLVYVSDAARMHEEGPMKQLISGADTGVIAENVYLFCASEGLATVVRASIDRAALAKELKLGPGQTIVLAQSVGYPAK